jgi:hypothetical protein
MPMMPDPAATGGAPTMAEEALQAELDKLLA